MLLKPKNTKYKKSHKGRISYNIRTNQDLRKENNYKYAIVADEPTRITAGIIYAIELSIKRKLKNSQNIESGYEIRVFPHIPVTKKPIEVRMGKGKGNIEYWMTRVQKGAILVEYSCDNINYAKSIWTIVNSKLPIKTKFINKNICNSIVE